MEVTMIKKVNEEKTLNYKSNDKMRPIFELFGLEYDPCGTYKYRVGEIKRISCGVNFETFNFETFTNNAMLHISQEGFIQIKITNDDGYSKHTLTYFLDSDIKVFFVEMKNNDIYKIYFDKSFKDFI